jgi:hypothetical protein
VEWQTLINSAIGASPVALLLGYGCFKLWAKVEEKDKIIAAKDLVIADLNEKRVNDLKAIASQNN